MNNITTFVKRLNEVENSPFTVKELIYEDNTPVDVIAKVLIGTLYDTSTSNTLDGMKREIVLELNDLLDAIIWAFALKCNDGHTSLQIIAKCDALKKAVREELDED